MNRWKTTILFLIVMNGLTWAWALPTFEPFANATANGGTAYANGAPLAHQTDATGEIWAQWNGGNMAYTVICTNTGLSYGGFPAGFPSPSTTNAVYLPGQVNLAGGAGGLSAALTFSKAIGADTNNFTTNAIYASFLMKVPNLGNLSSGSIYFAGFGTSTGDQTFTLPPSAMKIFLQGNSATAGQSTSYAIGVANNAGGSSAAFDGGGHTSNDVLFVVVEYEFGINGNPDVARLWVNPDSASFGSVVPPPTAASTNIYVTVPANQISQAADFYLLARSGGTLWGGLLVSDLRLGESWSYVTGGPEITPLPGPILSMAESGGNFILSSRTGAAGATNILLNTTNVGLPLANWGLLATSVADEGGHVSFTNSKQAVPNQFYALKLETGGQGPRAEGIDSDFRATGTFDWNAVAAAGIQFVCMKATWAPNGVDNTAWWTNSVFPGKYPAVQAAGLYTIAYHRCNPSLSASQGGTPQFQAQWFWNWAGPYIQAGGYNLSPALDLEDGLLPVGSTGYTGDSGNVSLATWCNEWYADLAQLAAADGVQIQQIIYVNAGSSCRLNDGGPIGGYSWIAWTNCAYPYGSGKEQIGTPWCTGTGCQVWGTGAWNIWQWAWPSETPVGHNLPGLPERVDQNVYNGTSADMVRILGTSAVSPSAASKGLKP